MGINDRIASGMTFGVPAHISLKDDRFTIVEADGTEETLEQFHLDVVICDSAATNARMFWDNDYDPKVEGSPPDCFSTDSIHPDESSPDMQSDSCAKCEWSKFGTARQGKGQRCRQYRFLAVLLADGAGPYRLGIPPASLKTVTLYTRELSKRVVNGHEVDASHVVTRLTLKDKQLTFTPVAYHKIDLLKLVAAHEFDLFVGGEGTPLEDYPAPLGMRIEHQPGTVERMPREHHPVQPTRDNPLGQSREERTPRPNQAMDQPHHGHGNGHNEPAAVPDKPKRTRRTREQIEADERAKAVAGERERRSNVVHTEADMSSPPFGRVEDRQQASSDEFKYDLPFDGE